MRRDFRKKQNENKIITYSIGGIILAIAVIIALISYGNSINKEAKQGQLNSDQIASILDNDNDSKEKNENEDESESASSSIGKSIEDEEKETKQEDEEKQSKENINKQESKKTVTINNSTVTKNNNSNSSKPTVTTATKPETKKELSFQKPVEGDVIREFAKENLIFSETLQEWVTHTGIDIKAPKTTVVQAAEAGTVKSIKNDPRYGLTLVIEHEDGFQTLYANLLSTEFVKEGEKVEKGQSIGTIGDTAVFESVDEPHLHFEIIKDSVSVDPSLYIK